MKVNQNNNLEIETMHKLVGLFEQESTHDNPEAARITNIALECLSHISSTEEKYYKVKGEGTSIWRLLAHALGISEVDKAKRQFAKTLKAMRAKTIGEVIPYLQNQEQKASHSQAQVFLQKIYQEEKNIFQHLLKNKQLPSAKELQREEIPLDFFLHRLVTNDALYNQLETLLLQNSAIKGDIQALFVQVSKEKWGKFSDTLMPSILDTLRKRAENAPPLIREEISKILQNSMEELRPFSTVMQCTTTQDLLSSVFAHTETKKERETAAEAIQEKFSIPEFLQAFATSEEALQGLEKEQNRLFLAHLLSQDKLTPKEMETFLLNAYNNSKSQLGTFFFTDLVEDLKKEENTSTLPKLTALLKDLNLLID